MENSGKSRSSLTSTDTKSTPAKVITHIPGIRRCGKNALAVNAFPRTETIACSDPGQCIMKERPAARPQHTAPRGFERNGDLDEAAGAADAAACSWASCWEGLR